MLQYPGYSHLRLMQEVAKLKGTAEYGREVREMLGQAEVAKQQATIIEPSEQRSPHHLSLGIRACLGKIAGRAVPAVVK